MKALALCWACLSLFVYVVEGNACTDKCDAMGKGDAITLCGMDGQTHRTTAGGLDNECYIKCNVAVYHPGPCGCPNNCYAERNWGTCQANKCQCKPGHGGADCSLITCPNVCSGRGQCVKIDDSGIDTCLCESKWTFTDCSIPVGSFAALPYGAIFPEAQANAYYKDDFLRDAHPVFNLNVIATLRVTVAKSDLATILDLNNIYTQDYVPASLEFDNGDVQVHFDRIGIKIKGSTSRWNYKHGYSLSLTKFDDPASLYGIKKLGIKAESKDSVIRNQLIRDFLRSMGVPVQRASYAALYMNGFFAGLYWMHEDIGNDFLSSFYGKSTAAAGSMYQPYHGDLSFKGADPELYRLATYKGLFGPPKAMYEKTSGSSSALSNFADLANLVQTLTLSDSQMVSWLRAHFDVSSFVRCCVVEAFGESADHYLHNSKNYMLINDNNNLASAQWHYALLDFDAVLRGGATNVHDFLFQNGKTQALAWRIFKLPEFMTEFDTTMKIFLDAAFGDDSGLKPNKASARFDAILNFILPVQQLDTFWELSFGVPRANFVQQSVLTSKYLKTRPSFVRKQLPSGLPSALPIRTKLPSTLDDGQVQHSGLSWWSTAGFCLAAAVVCTLMLYLLALLIRTCCAATATKKANASPQAGLQKHQQQQQQQNSTPLLQSS